MMQGAGSSPGGDGGEAGPGAGLGRDPDQAASGRAAPASSADGSQDGDLRTRIEAARKELKGEPRQSLGGKYNALTLAWRMTLELVVGTAFGFGIGWALDQAFGTSPAFLLIFGLFGVAAGVKLVFETAREASRPAPGSAGEQTRSGADRDA